MALIERDLFGTHDKVKIAIDRLKTFEPPEGYYLAFSGGKDSIVIHQLAIESGIKFDAHYNLTTIDPPELVVFIKAKYPNVIIDKPKLTMWQLIVQKRMPPTRKVRYCCESLKEHGGVGRYTITGVRWAESVRRKNTRHGIELQHKNVEKRRYSDDNDEGRMMLENCIKKSKVSINPIIEWQDEDVWEFIRSRNLEYCKLYDEGYKRLGCIGCPNSGTAGMLRDFERYPTYKQNYLKAFERMLDKRERDGLKRMFRTAEDVMKWWISGKSMDVSTEDIYGQITIDDIEVKI
jgi:phosphoadenosine phosphosulfate reductase